MVTLETHWEYTQNKNWHTKTNYDSVELAMEAVKKTNPNAMSWYEYSDDNFVCYDRFADTVFKIRK
jgi:ABC-type branched-subunit amino acid transport system substrate-binding protein